MANNNRDNTKGSFWKKLFNNAAAREGINDHEEERQQVNPAPSNYSSSANDMLTANSSSDNEYNELQAQDSGFVVDEQGSIAAPVDEISQELAEKESAIRQLEDEIVLLEERSALLQQKAVDTLSGLAEAERQYNEANQAVNQAVDNETAVREAQEQLFATAEAENEALISQAEGQIAELRATLAAKKQDLASALAEIDRAAMNLATDQVNGQAKVQDKFIVIDEELADLQKFQVEAEAAKRDAEEKINSLQLAVKRAQNEYDRAANELSTAEYRFKENKFDEKLASLAAANSQNQERLNKELSQTEESFTQQIDAAETKYEQLAAEIDEKKNEVAVNSDRISVAEESCIAAQKEYQRLQTEKATVVKEADAEIQLISGRVEAARKDVEDKKEAYAEAQKQVQLSTSISVKANAQASAAREKADKAAMEKADAATAAQMAQKLKSDATVARVNTDEASSLLLSKAEMVLLNTSEKAIRLLEEKTSLAEIAEQEAAHLRSEADLAAAEAKRAAGVADKMIALWLAAEESLVKITTDAEENKRQIEERTALVVEQYEQNIAAAQQTIEEQQQESLAATAACDKAKEELAHYEKEYADIEAQITDLKDNYAIEKARLEEELTAAIASSEQTITECQNEQAAMLRKIEDKRAAFEYRENQLSTLVEELNTEQESLAALLSRTDDKLTGYQERIIQKQAEHHSALAEMNALISDTLSYLTSCRSKAERISANIAELEKGLSDTVTKADKIEEDSVDKLVQIRADGEKEIASAVKITSAARDTAGEYYAKLQSARTDAEVKVKAAVDASVARLEALNRLSCQYIEKDIFGLDNDIKSANERMLATKEVFEEAKAIYFELEAESDSLLKEKAELTDLYDHKYQELTAEKGKEIELLEQEIAFLTNIEKECQTALADANSVMDKIIVEYTSAQERLHARMAEKDKLSAESAEQLATLDENYRIAMEGDGEEIPLLRKVFEDCKQKREQAIAAFAAADSQWQQQVATTADLRNNELAFKQDSSSQLAQLKDEDAVRLQEMQDSIAALESEKSELDAAYAKAQEYAATNETARQEAEGYLQRIIDEEQHQQDTVDKELRKINDHLQLLKDDAEDKEQKYRTTANIVKNSLQLMKDAEDTLTLAQNTFNRAQAELNAAEAAYNTSRALADQAAQSYQTVDNDTAAILKRASEELVVAADNAAVFVEEKKKEYLLAKEDFDSAKSNFESVSQTVNEAPDLADEEKAVWLKADSEYQKYKQEAEQQIPAIKNAFAAFLADRANAKAAAQSTVNKCVKESEETKRNLESLSGRIMETLAEISRLTSEKQMLENSIIENQAKVEKDIETSLLAKQEARENAEELTNRLEMVMLQRKEERDNALEQFEKAKNHYQDVCNAVDRQYYDDKVDIENRLAKMVRAADKASFIFSSTAELRKQSAEKLAAAQERYQTIVESKERAFEAKAKLIEKKDEELHELEEVKLRVLGNNAMARIAAEGKAAKANSDYVRKKALFEEADKTLQDLLQQRDLASHKLATLQEDGERAIAAAKENILYMMKDTAV